MMRLLITALAFVFAVSLNAQEQVVTYPYNSDVDKDLLIVFPDARSVIKTSKYSSPNYLR